MGDHRESLWHSIPPLAPGSKCVHCGEVPPPGAPLVERLLQCEKCGVGFHEACYFVWVSLDERALRTRELEQDGDRYAFIHSACRS